MEESELRGEEAETHTQVDKGAQRRVIMAGLEGA